MTNAYQQRRFFKDHKETHMTVVELAALCHVNPNAIRKACQLGKVQAIYAGRMWLIPRLDARVYADAYIKQNSGETWTPKVKPLDKRVWQTNPHAEQSLKAELSAEHLTAIDDYRREHYERHDRRISRTAVIREALERMLFASCEKEKS
jgi:hypothetical protein